MVMKYSRMQTKGKLAFIFWEEKWVRYGDF
jgi:hypothetical protein